MAIIGRVMCISIYHVCVGYKLLFQEFLCLLEWTRHIVETIRTEATVKQFTDACRYTL